MLFGLRLGKVNRSATPTFNALARPSSQATERGIDAAFKAADKLHRTADCLCKLNLRQSPIPTKFCDPLAKSLLKHGAQIANFPAQRNAGVIRVRSAPSHELIRPQRLRKIHRAVLEAENLQSPPGKAVENQVVFKTIHAPRTDVL